MPMELGQLIATLPTEEQDAIKATVEELIKAGAKHSKADVAEFQGMHDMLMRHGAKCKKDNCDDDGEKDGEDDAGDTEKNAVITEGGTITPQRPGEPADTDKSAPADVADVIDAKTLPLDSLVYAVREAFSNLRYGADIEGKRPAAPPLEGNDGDGDYDDYADCISVYPDYAIAKLGLTYYRVNFTLGPSGATLAPYDQWQKVEQEWVTKSLPDTFPVDDPNLHVKSLGGDRVGMYLVAWGSEKQRDLTKEYFTPKTQELLTVFKAIGKIPLLYHHAMDNTLKSNVIGFYDVMVEDEVGIWAEAQLDKANKYSAAVKELARRGALGASSGTLPGARKVAPTGEIERWCIVEGSLTPTPCEPRLRTDMPVTVLKSFYDQLGLTLPETVEQTAKGAEEARPDDIEQEMEALRLFELSL